jgi:hypothetical protein
MCFRRRPVQVFALALGLMLATSTVHGYTLVLRGGKIVEIPGTFTATSRTITYEVGNGFQVTLQLAAIDIPATDRANREAPGSFQKRLQENPVPTRSQLNAEEFKTQERTITNRDLESFERKRREGELAYERRRKELGLPSAEETRQKAAAESAQLKERFEQQQAEQRANEAYWRDRALTLRSEIASTDAELNSVRQQLDWLPSNSFSVVPNGGSFLSAPARVNPSLLSPTVPRVFVTPQIGPAVRGRAFGTPVQRANVFGGRGFSRVAGFGGPARIHGGGLRRGFGSSFGFFPGFVGVPDDLAYERTALVTRLNELVARRAGLAARWRALEDEARRAGAQPGWLR